MRPVSERFLQTIRGSHRISLRATVLDVFQTGMNPTGAEIPVFGGDVTSDANAKIRSTLDLTTAGHADKNVLLEPFGSEIYVERGVFYGVSIEWVSLGYYRIDTVKESSVSLGDLRIGGTDRMAQIINARLPFAQVFPAGTLFETIFDTLVQDVYPSAVIEYDHTPGSLFIARTHVCERDRYAFMDELATARGKIFYFDHRGVLVVKDRPMLGTPVFAIDAGADGVLLDPTSEESTRDGAYNGVVAFGEGADETPPVSALVFDNNPESNTYWFGPFGKVPRFFFSPFITTTAQALSAAQSLLDKVLGTSYSLDLSMVPNTALEVFDTVEIIMPHHQTRQLMLQTMRIPLSVETAMSANVADKTDSEIGGEE